MSILLNFFLLYFFVSPDDAQRIRGIAWISGLYAMKNTRAVFIVPVAGVSFAVIQFFAVNGSADVTEIPHRPPLTVQFLLSLLAQLFLRDKPGHEPHLPSHGVSVLYHAR
jgi:hypothetical protein